MKSNQNLYRNRYRTPSIRLQNWDYRNDAVYFVTICTKNHENFFGDIENKEMYLSNMGTIADVLWYEIPFHTNNIQLYEFVVMPNHIHGIIQIKNGFDGELNSLDDVNHNVEMLHAMSLHDKNESMANISPKSGSLSTIIRSYKSAVTKHIHRLGYNFIWQTRFHEHIIRDIQAYETIRNYILTNPQKWEDDKYYE